MFAGALQGIFTQIINGDDTVREKAIKFLSVRLKSLGEDLVSAKIEEFIVEESKKVMHHYYYWFIKIYELSYLI